MNTINSTDSYAQFMKLVATARQRNNSIANKTTAARGSTAAFPAIGPQARPETSMMPVVNRTEGAQVKGRILGNYFDAYA
jgi:hypothetical protein